MAGRTEIGGGARFNNWRTAIWGGAALLLLLPLAASQVSDSMAWDSGDFILAGALLAAACGAWELAIRKTRSWTHAAAAMVAAGTAFLLFLVNGAVGILGSEDDQANLVFLAVIAVALGGTLAARLRARGMARAMAVTAGAQVAAGIAGLTLVPDVRGFLVGTALFTSLWLLSAWLFRRAAAGAE